MFCTGMSWGMWFTGGSIAVILAEDGGRKMAGVGDESLSYRVSAREIFVVPWRNVVDEDGCGGGVWGYLGHKCLGGDN